MKKKAGDHASGNLLPGANKILLKMKLTLCIILFSFLGAIASESYSQTTKLSLDLKNTSVKEVLGAIENQSEFFFLYSEKIIDVNRNVNIEVQGSTIEKILDKIFAGTNVNYTVKGRQIVLTTPEANNFFGDSFGQQQKPVSGKVNDSSGAPLPGVTVLVKGTTTGTITDSDGKYTLANVSGDATLVFSFVGMKTQKIAVAGKSTINVILEQETVGIEEVVAIGYGTVKKSDLTGAVGSVKAEDILKQPVARLDQALQGQISGVQVTSISGAPGTGSTIRIRGGNSINAGNEPLYVIDGFIGGGDLNTINPSNIESIEVLKDASSTAIYGSRGSNGVILITTKRGAGAKGFGVSYDAYVGIQSPVKKIDLLSGPEFAAYRNEYSEYIGEEILFPDLNSISNTDWQDILFRNAPLTDHNLSFYNNSENGNYFGSINYLDQGGIQLGSSFKRYQISLNFDHKLNEIFKIGASVSSSYSILENPRAFAIAQSVLPTAPIYDQNGKFFSLNVIKGSTYNSPVAQDKLISDETNKRRVLGNVYFQFSPLKGLDFKSTFGFDFNNENNNRYESVELPTRFEGSLGGIATISTIADYTIQNENTINYNKKVANHEFNLLGGLTYQHYYMEDLDVKSEGFSNDVTSYHAIETGNPELITAKSGEAGWTLLSALYRLNYSYQGKYLVTVSGRHDGSSRLAKGKQWQFFPSAALAWRISEEPFLENSNVISNLKTRISYGRTGSQSITPYATLARLISGTNYLGDKQLVTFLPAISSNPDLSWEVTNQFDFGTDIGFYNNRLNFGLDLYYKKTTDLLLQREIAFQTGFTQRLENVGSLENKGFEINVDGHIIQKSDFSWSSKVTFATNKNEVLELSGGKDFIESGSYTKGGELSRGSRIIVGEPIGVFYGVKFLGLYQENDPDLEGHLPGDPKFKDLDGNGIITVDDAEIIGKGTPDFYGGLNNNFEYHGFTLSFFFDFSYGNDIYDMDGTFFNTGNSTNVYGKYRNRWTPTNTDTDIPRAGSMLGGYFNGYPGQDGTSYDVYDGSYIRLKNLNLQYNIPTNKKIFKSLSVYTTATNLFTITKYQGYSPDVNSEGTNPIRRGFDKNAYPPARTVLLGIKANF